MKLTKKYLQDLIQEEANKILSERDMYMTSDGRPITVGAGAGPWMSPYTRKNPQDAVDSSLRGMRFRRIEDQERQDLEDLNPIKKSHRNAGEGPTVQSAEIEAHIALVMTALRAIAEIKGHFVDQSMHKYGLGPAAPFVQRAGQELIDYLKEAERLFGIDILGRPRP